MELLHGHLAAQRDAFDEWFLLLNTADAADIAYCEALAAAHPDWISVKRAPNSRPEAGNANLPQFYDKFCTEPGTAYLKLDDDICYLSPSFVETIFAFREERPWYAAVFGNIVNNAALTWMHWKLGNFKSPRPLVYACGCPGGWSDPAVAIALHETFLRTPRAPSWAGFDRLELTDRERVSINAICWFGEALAASGPCGADDEAWFCADFPRAEDTVNAVCGAAVCAHFAFYTQRAALDATDLLDRYALLVPA
jgi:hypothetical protein